MHDAEEVLTDSPNQEGKGTLNIIYQNCGGWNSFSHDTKSQLDKYDMVSCGETWLDQGSVHHCILPGFQGYHAYHDRTYGQEGRPFGGVSVFMDTSRILEVTKQYSSTCKSIVWTEFEGLQLTIANVYMAPENSHVWELLPEADPLFALKEGVIKAKHKGHAVLVLGDMNARIGGLSECPSRKDMQVHPAEPFYPLPNCVEGSGLVARSEQDHKCNPRGEELMQILMDLGLVVLNGRAGSDAGCGACTFLSNTKCKSGELGASTVDLACITAEHFPCVKVFEVDQTFMQPGKHAALSVSLTFPSSHRCHNASKSKGKDRLRKVKVCRPDVDLLTAHARPLFADKEAYFESVLSCVKDGTLTSTDAINEVIMAIKQCVNKAQSSAKEHMLKMHQAGSDSKLTAPWFDQEAESVRGRFQHAWNRWKTAIKEDVSAELLAELRSEALSGRYEWQRYKRRRRRQYILQQEKKLIEKFFSDQPRDFWKVFNRSAVHQCELDNVDACTAYFRELLGTQAGEPDPRKGSWCPEPTDTGFLVEADADVLNADITKEELCMHIKSCKNGKAADLDGITAEALKLTVACQANTLLDCLVEVLDECHAQMPKQMTLSKLTPIPKCSNSGHDHSLHRGIAVGSVFSKLKDRIMHSRFAEVSEKNGLRCPTQCGFRPEHGTLDALFTLQHTIDKARHQGACLIACLVDFLKAFDKMDRQLMIRRCKELGVTGKFLEALVALYDDINMVVTLNGQCGEPFQTYQGTKQGSELSPLLFGLFIEQLHYLLLNKVPGAGPIIGELHIPDLMYADDVMLMAVDSHAEMQGLLDALHLFCQLFGMEVNMRKTKIVLFRPIGKPVPEGLQGKTWEYAGSPVSVVDEEKYLGLMLHGAQGPTYTVEQRAKAGSQAAHAMLFKCVDVGLDRPDIVCMLFDYLVKPVLSYGCQIWGPYMAVKYLKDPLNRKNAPERVHTDFLRQVSGMPKFVHKASLYKEMGREPLMVQWLVLAARLWNNCCDRDPTAIMHMALKDNIKLMLGKCRTCWSYCFFKAMHAIGVIQHQVWNGGLESSDTVLSIRIDEVEVKQAALLTFDKQWELGRAYHDPRSAPSNHITCSTYLSWVGMPDGKQGANHMGCCMPRHLRRDLMALRLGCHRLNIQFLRMQKARVARQDRVCPLCQSDGLHECEDVRHFMLECGFYSPIRSKHSNLFDNLRARGLAPDAMLRALFDHEHQLDLACCVQDMLKLRDRWLHPGGKPSGASVADSSELDLSDLVDSLGYLYDTFEEGDNRLHLWDPIKCEPVSEKGTDDYYDEEEELKEVGVAAGSSHCQLSLPPGFTEILI